MKSHLEFKEQILEKSYLNYNIKRRRPILRLQRVAVGFFSFLGIFHLIYLQPLKKETTVTTDSYLIIATIGVIFSMIMGFCSKLREKDSIILFTNLLINFILIEPNFLVLTETRELSKLKYFWLGFRISSINLVLLLCYNSFIYKIFQSSVTIIYLLIRMRKEASLHNLLVDTSMGFLICIFFLIQEKGERMTYQDLHMTSSQREDWKNFINFLPEGVAIFSNKQNCVFMNESVKKIFNIYEAEDMTRVILSLTRMIPDDQHFKESKYASARSSPRSSPKESKLIDNFLDFYKKFQLSSKPKRKNWGFKKNMRENSKRGTLIGFDEKLRDLFLSEFEGKYLSLKLTHIDFEDMDSTLVLISDISMTIKSHVLEENRKYRDMLFASFSHEIRTPLNCIILLLGKLIKTKNTISDKILSKYVYPSFYSGQILLHLVNDILDFSFLIRDELRLNINLINIKEECLEIMEVISMQAKIKGINLNIKLDRNLPPLIRTDAARLKQILCHLLLNALKYTYVGHITITVLNSSDFEDGIEISVRDTGIGMNYEEQLRLKDKIQLSSVSNLKVSKHGAGASLKTLLSQGLALTLGCEGDYGLKFISSPNDGSVFYFTIKNYTEFNKGTLKESQCLDQNLEVLEEKLRSGIHVNWIAGEKTPKNLREISRNKYSSSIENFPKIRSQKQSLSDLYFIEENINQAEKSKFEIYENYDNCDSIFMESNYKIKLPDFDEVMLKKQTERKRKKDIHFKSENIYSNLGENSTTSEFFINCSHAKILVVDDDEFNILAVKTILKQSSLSISAARNGSQAIELITKEIKDRKKCCKRFKLILMDVNMPIMGGLEATRLLKQDMKDNKIPWMPIVGCTAFVGSTDEILCRENGMDDYEAKPLTNQKLTRLLKKWMNFA